MTSLVEPKERQSAAKMYKDEKEMLLSSITQNHEIAADDRRPSGSKIENDH